MDGECLIDVFPRALREFPDGEFTITFPSGEIRPPGEYPDTLRKSIGYWVPALSESLEAQGLTLAVLGGKAEVLLELHPAAPGGWRCTVLARDDRGRACRIPVEHA